MLQIWIQERQEISSLLLSSCSTFINSFYSQGLPCLEADPWSCEVLQGLGFLLLAPSISTVPVSWIPSEGTASPHLTTECVSHLLNTDKTLLLLPVLPLLCPTWIAGVPGHGPAPCLGSRTLGFGINAGDCAATVAPLPAPSPSSWQQARLLHQAPPTPTCCSTSSQPQKHITVRRQPFCNNVTSE